MHSLMHLIGATVLTGLHLTTIMVGMAGVLPTTRMVGMESVDSSNSMRLGSSRLGLGDVFLCVTSTVRSLSLPVNHLLGLVHRLRDIWTGFGTLFTSGVWAKLTFAEWHVISYRLP